MKTETPEERKARRSSVVMMLLKKQEKRPKPTIAELEAILNSDFPPSIDMRPDGSVVITEPTTTTVSALLDAIEASDAAITKEDDHD